MSAVRRPFALITVVAAAAVLLSATVQAQTVNVCQSKKKSCVAKKAAALLRCHVLAERTGAAVDSACTQEARDKFDGAGDPTRGCFGRLEASGNCITANDTAPLESKVDAFVDDVVSTVDPDYPVPVKNRCSAGKKKCIRGTVKALLTCHARAEKTGTLDPSCIQHAHDRFDGGATPSRGCFATLEAQGGCLTMGDTDAVETKIDDFVHEVVCALDPSTPECSVPTPTPTTTPVTTPTTTPGGSCPASYRLTIGPASDVDIGWTGFAHDNAMTSNTRLTLAVTDCANPLTPCGQCSLSGPLPNGGGAAFQNHRCRGDASGANGTWIACATDAECPGTGNACVFFMGPPQPLSDSGFTFCTSYAVAAPVTGTIDSDTGDLSLATTIGFAIFVGAQVATPCPQCVSGACVGGDRDGQPCNVQGTSAEFGEDVSLDCPPSAAGTLNTMGAPPPTFPLTLTTGTQSLTLDPTSPQCSGTGAAGELCQCDSCNDAAATPCHTQADCIAVGATVCGGRRCIGGTNANAPCANNSECPGGACSYAGTRTQPNLCNDGVCSPNPGDTASTNEGVCAAGPSNNHCAIARFRGCLTDADCTAPGDHCIAQFVDCFTDNGVAGGTITASGSAADAPTLAGLACLGPVRPGGALDVVGLPGPARFTLRAEGVLQ